ncbi:Lactonase, 7-bladed beta-propeller-domain-containing protein [Mycena floridula]|nr:Lactonase, 7-bladed beta-propeller-domain-containing protein [Mycena floridula]
MIAVTTTAFLFLSLSMAGAQTVSPVLILAGGSNSADVAILEFNPASNSLTVKGYTTGGDSDNFKAWMSRHPTNPNIVIASNDHAVANATGYITSFALNSATGDLTFLDRKDSGGIQTAFGVAAAHAAFFPSGDIVGVANYFGQTASTFKFDPATGKIGDEINTEVLNFGGYTIKQGQIPISQETAHPHQILTHPFLPILYIPDLGQDLLHRFSIGKDGNLTALSGYKQKLGSGPRHASISSDGKWLYLLHELGVTLSVYSVDVSDKSTGKLTLLQEGVPIYPSNVTASLNISAAEVHVSNDGRFVYATNRNLTSEPLAPGGIPDTVSVYHVGTDGRINRVQSAAIPNSRQIRAFELSPGTGGQDYVIAAGQFTNNTSIMKRSRLDGKLHFAAAASLSFSPSTFIWV